MLQETTLGKLKDGQQFKLSNRSSGVFWKVISKAKGLVYYTSTKSERSDSAIKSTIVYI